MTCDIIQYRDGRKIIMCSRGTRPKRCQFCRELAAFECDGPKPRKKSGTCDKRMCAAHRTKIGDDLVCVDSVDLCPECAATKAQPSQFEMFATLCPCGGFALAGGRCEQCIVLGGLP